MHYINFKRECQDEVTAQNEKIQQRERISPEKIITGEWADIYNKVESPLVKRLTYYKWRNVKTEAALRSIGEKTKATLIDQCGTYVRIKQRNGHDIFSYANFCRQRLCAVCGWRRSAKFVAQMIPVTKLLTGKGYKFIFITLTVPNCPADAVRDTISELLKGWDRLNKKTRYKTAWKGFCRSIEVTYNAKHNTYHPHIHALIAVDTKYYRIVSAADEARTAPKIMTDFELSLSSDWRAALKNPDYNKLTYPLQVSALPANRAARQSGQAVSTAAAVETLKYAFKVNHKDINNDTIAALLYGLDGRRLISFGGVIAEARKQLGQPDIDEAIVEFDNYSNSDDSDSTAVAETTYIFSMNGWKIIEDIEGDEQK